MTHGLYSRHKNIALAIKLWELLVDVWWEEDSFCTFLHLDRTFFLRRTLCTIFSTFRELWYDAASACYVGYLTVSAMFYGVNTIRASCQATCTVKSSRDIHVLAQYDGAKRTCWLAVWSFEEEQKNYISRAHLA